MVDKLASYIVNKIFGRYFEGFIFYTSISIFMFISSNYFILGLDNISIGILSSSVNLSNLKVKDDIFDDYDLPFTVKQGTFHSILLNQKNYIKFCISFIL